MWRLIRIMVALVAVPILLALTAQLVAARWALITNIAVNPVRVCRDGMFLGIGNQHGPGWVTMTVKLMPNGNSVVTDTFYLPYDPVPDVAGVTASGFFDFYYNTLLPAGSRIKVGPPSAATPAMFTVENCAIGDQPFPAYFLSRSNDVPRPIPPSPSRNVITSALHVPIQATIGDINVALLITHTWDSDLVVTLTSPSGTSIGLFDSVGGSGDNFGIYWSGVWAPGGFMPDFILDDESSYSLSGAAPPFTSASYMPQGPGQLSDFYGENAAGTWTLTIADRYLTTDHGTLLDWALEIESHMMYLPAIMKPQ